MKPSSSNISVCCSWYFNGPRVTWPARIGLALLLIWNPLASSGAEVDPQKLPAPAGNVIDFDRDVRPIFEQSCLRCHGSERPKSNFRLDNRESALMGGDNNFDDIIPGDSAKSVLIHYVARLVESLEMPPEGKGDPLAPEQVGVLRAWIDQGAKWSATNTFPQSTYSIVPFMRWVTVDGDKKKFRELEGYKEGWGGGIESFSMEQRKSADTRFLAEGHFLFPDEDFQLKLSWTRKDAGFIRLGFEHWRRYYDDTGGYYRSNSPPSFDLDRDLYLDIGRAWIDVGLTSPEGPQVVLGYEFQFRDGAKSTLQWGNTNGLDPNAKNIYPSAKNIDEQTHILKLDVTFQFHDWLFEDNARMEFYHLQTSSDTMQSPNVIGLPQGITQTSQSSDHVRGQNSLRVERHFTDWFSLYGGYLYSRLDGDVSFDQNTTDLSGAPTTGFFWNSDDISLKRETHAFSLAESLLPLDWLTFSTGFQAEWTRQSGFGNINYDEGDPNQPGFFLTNRLVRSDLDQQRYSEQATLRFTKIPWTVLFAEGRWSQDRIGQFEQQMGDEALSISFLRDTEFANNRQNYRAGFSTSPFRWVSLSGHFLRDISNSDYDHDQDTFTDPTGAPIFPGEGYSAFIRERKIDTDEIQAKLALRPANWLRTTFTYKHVDTDYSTTTDPALIFTPFVVGGRINAGEYGAHVYGLNLTVAPITRLFLSGGMSYSDTRTVTAIQQSAPTVVAPYRGDVYSGNGAINYVLNTRTALLATYQFSKATYAQNNVTDGLPLGLNFTRHEVTGGISRKLTEQLVMNLRYSFSRYDEPTSGGFNDFTAHGVFATFTAKLP